MNKTTKCSMLVFGLALMAASSCKKEKTPPVVPVVTTSALTNITPSSATAGGTITSDGGATITASGVVWSKTNNTPTLADSVVSSTTTTGSFTINLANLDFTTTYYLRAYATNSVGTGYGNVVTLNTTNDTTKVRFTYMGQEVIYGVITSPVTNRKWMDRNLGASQAATSLTDAAAYGHLFQWGRLADGHQIRTSDTTNILSLTDVPGHNKFIVPPATPRDWRSPKNDNLWQGSTGINQPCPSGWHVPTKVEWESENLNPGDVNSWYNQLKLTQAGFRSRLTGALGAVGTQFTYWSSTPEPAGNAFSITSGGVAQNQRGLGASVRCIKD